VPNDPATPSATYGLTHEFPLAETRMRRSVMSDPQSGLAFRRQTQSSHAAYGLKKERREWELAFNHATETEKDAAEALWDDSAAGADVVAFTPPGEGTAILVRILNPTFVTRRGSGNSWSFQLHVQEVV